MSYLGQPLNLSILHLNISRLVDLAPLEMLKNLEDVKITARTIDYNGPLAEHIFDALSRLNNSEYLSLDRALLTQDQLISLSENLDLTTITANGKIYLGGKFQGNEPFAHQQATSSGSPL